jgi:predicted unusual protein kinase regulating ubiquinone biosynthesis (AarF/ABC1/UbiB family)
MMALKMAFIYQFSSDDWNKKHDRCSKIMLEAFKKNSGLYVKLGQLIATVCSSQAA